MPGLSSRRVFGLLPGKSTRRCHKNGSRLAGGAHRVSRRCTRRRPRQMQVTRLHAWPSSEHVSPFRSTMRALAARRRFRFPPSLSMPALFAPARTGNVLRYTMRRLALFVAPGVTFRRQCALVLNVAAARKTASVLTEKTKRRERSLRACRDKSHCVGHRTRRRQDGGPAANRVHLRNLRASPRSLGSLAGK